MKKSVGSVIVSAAALLPFVALAQNEFGEVSNFFGKISSFINSTLIPLVFGIALLMFIWGVFKYMILGGGDEGSREEGKQLMIWAIVGFVVMVSVFGIVNLIANGLGFGGQENIQNIPNVPRNNS
jgi:hypothetical protein